jgi:hypothetical protein
MSAIAASTTAMLSNVSKSYEDFVLCTIRVITPSTHQEVLESCAEGSAARLYIFVISQICLLLYKFWENGMEPVHFARFAVFTTFYFFTQFATVAMIHDRFTRGAFVSYALLAVTYALMHLTH